MRIREWRAFWNRLAGVLAPVSLLAVSAISASAQNASNFATNLDPLFQANLARPSDLANPLQYAASVTPNGDIESAISTYEQLLFYNPKLSRVRFELGVLYYRLGSYEMARGYFQSALEMADVSPGIQQKSQDYLYFIDKKLRPDQLSGFAQTGLGYQTNAGAGPGAQSVLASGRTFDSRFFNQADWNWFGAFGLNYVHDFGNQRGDTFEASAIGYDAQQFRLHQFDAGLLEIRVGPRFGIFTDSASEASLKPYVVATGALLADAAYFGGIGGGLTAHVSVGNVALDPYVEIVQQTFRNSSLYPLASGLNGTLSTYGLQAAGPVYAGLTWQTRASVAHATAAFGPDAYDSYAADVWLPWNFSLTGDGRTWTLTPTAGVTHWQYSAPDPTLDPTMTPRSLEWRVGLGLNVPIWTRVTLATLVLYRSDSSNIPVFAMHDLAVTAGPTIKF